LLHVAPLFLLGIGITIGDLTFYTARAIIDFDYPYIERPVIAAKALWFYVAKLLWPYPLMAIYPKWDINPANWLNWLPMLAGMVLLLALWLARQRIGRGPLAAVLFFAVIVSPMLGLGLNVFMQFSFAADRYQYLASAGLLALVVALAVVACRRLPSQVMHGAKALAALLIVACVALTWQQVQLFKNDVTFWNHVVATNPAAHSAYYNQGLALVDAGRPEDGIAAYMQALERDPDSAGTYINLSFALLEVNRLEESEQAARRATELDPKALLAHQNLASALHKLERYEETLAALKNVAALMKRPTAEHNFHMGHIAGLLDRTQEAERHLRRALSIGPEHQEALNELVHLYLKAGRYADAQKANPRLHDTLKAAAYHHYSEGRYDQALQNYQHSLGIDPDDAQMHVNQGYALEQLQRMEEAEQSYKRALAIEPNMQTALSQLAALYFNGRRYEDALNLYRRNVELEPDSAEAHSNLGSALAQSGRLQEAIESFQRALELNPQLASARTNLDKAREMLGSQ
ncbi:MAG: tetratricopeptide repeat protein, partial [Pseudomonadales bacterium]